MGIKHLASRHTCSSQALLRRIRSTSPASIQTTSVIQKTRTSQSLSPSIFSFLMLPKSLSLVLLGFATLASVIPLTSTTAVPRAMQAGLDSDTATLSPSPEVNDPFPNELCAKAAAACKLGFSGMLAGVPSFPLNGPADTAFTPALVWKDGTFRLGVANSSREGEFVVDDDSVELFSMAVTGGQAFSPLQFKPIGLPEIPFSGIAHETFQGNEEFVKGKCVRVYITSYQTLNDAEPPVVIGNVHDAEECVLFKVL